jgi:class 3 adenylate cyclase
MTTIVLFADISGFTKVGEACAKKGLRGNEELAFVINRYMEGMVSNLSKYGGDIIKFVGDAMIVMWPEEKAPLNETEQQKNERYKNAVRKAIHCSLDIQK